MLVFSRHNFDVLLMRNEREAGIIVEIMKREGECSMGKSIA